MNTVNIIQQGVVQGAAQLYNLEIKAEDFPLSTTRKEFEGDYTLVVFPFTKHVKKSPEAIGQEAARRTVSALRKFQLTTAVGDPEKGVAVTSCGRPNRFEVRLPAFDAATQKVVFDYAALVAGADLLVNGGGPPGCMSGTTDPECTPTFPKMGLDVTSGAPSGAQGIFKAE
mgnify:CR=1 FL=1